MTHHAHDFMPLRKLYRSSPINKAVMNLKKKNYLKKKVNPDVLLTDFNFLRRILNVMDGMPWNSQPVPQRPPDSGPGEETERHRLLTPHEHAYAQP